MESRNRSYCQRLDTRATAAKLAEDARKIVKDSKEVLDCSMVDTFLGRKTQDPFPKEPECP